MGAPGADPALRIRRDCRYCGSSDLRAVLDLGEQPPSNSFIRIDEIDSEQRYPLELYVCASCWLSQLVHVVPGAMIFDDYLYLSSTSRALVEHYRRLVAEMTERLSLRSGDLVVDIGCNDGVLLRSYDDALTRVGVEPSRVAEIARSNGFEVIQDFFDEGVARRIIDKYGTARVITATNVFAHVDDISAFARAAALLIGDDGVFVVEVSYLPDLISDCLFDTIYHEHLCYCALTPMIPFFASCGLDITDAERIPFGASGPAIRLTAQTRGRRSVASRVADLVAFEHAWGISSMETYVSFASRAQQIRGALRDLLTGLRTQGARVAAFGAPAKGNTLLNYIGASPSLIEFVADNTSLKQGRVTPGTHIPVVSDAHLLREMPPYALLLAWNYLDFFLAKSKYIANGGRFVVPLPDPRIVP